MRIRTLWRFLASEYLKAFAGTLFAVCAIYLVVDYIDRAKLYTGEGWLRATLELYAWKAVLEVQELAPAAMLLAGGITLAGLRKRGEYTALRALAISPLKLVMPLAVACLLVGGAMTLADDLLVGHASRRVDEILVGRFRSYGDWGMYFGQTRWFRGKRHIYHLREGSATDGFGDVTIYTLSDSFRLSQRVDARRMIPLEGHRWRLEEGSQRDLTSKGSRVETFLAKEITLDEAPSTFQISKGRPEQLGTRALRQQIRLRQNVGLPADRYVLALHNRFAYPLGGLPGMLLAAAFVLRPGRRNYLTSAIADGFLIIVLLWSLLVMAKAAALAGLLAPAIAAWMPILVLVPLSALALRAYAK